MYLPRLRNATTAYERNGRAILLREKRYMSTSTSRTIPDDGIVDDIAVDRAVLGDTTVRLTPREVLCVVARLAWSGASDREIAARLGHDGKAGTERVYRIRERNRVTAGRAA